MRNFYLIVNREKPRVEEAADLICSFFAEQGCRCIRLDRHDGLRRDAEVAAAYRYTDRRTVPEDTDLSLIHIFYPTDEMQEQVDVYFTEPKEEDDVPSGIGDIIHNPMLDTFDGGYVKSKVEKILDVLPELDKAIDGLSLIHI